MEILKNRSITIYFKLISESNFINNHKQLMTLKEEFELVSNDELKIVAKKQKEMLIDDIESLDLPLKLDNTLILKDEEM